MLGETNRQAATNLIATEMAKYAVCRAAGEQVLAWRALERAHVIPQPYFIPHLRSHWKMALFALALRDWREVAGQLFRLALVPLGSLTGRLPAGNTGRARQCIFSDSCSARPRRATYATQPMNADMAITSPTIVIAGAISTARLTGFVL